MTKSYLIVQKEAGKTLVESFRSYGQQQKDKIEDLGITQQKRGKRKRKY